MISILIKVITVVFILIALSTIQKKKNIVITVLKTIKDNYLSIIDSSGTIMKILLKFACVLIIVQNFLISFQICCIKEEKGIILSNIVKSIAVGIFTTLFMYFFFGIILAVFTKSIDVIGNVKDNKISTKMMISFLLLALLTFFSFVSEKEMKENLISLFCGLVTCYVLNIQILLKIVQNPFCLVAGRKQYKSEDRVLVIFSSILIIVMIIVNMYLLVLWTDFTYKDAYFCSTKGGEITKWKLLYYTIISFTTIGYGDVSPVRFQSQAVAILIAITSVICLVIFVSSVLSEKDEILGENQEQSQEISKEK